jgi:MFS family permease
VTVAAEAEGFSSLRVRSLAAAIGSVAAVGVALSLSIPLLSLEMERMGVSNTGIGINTAVAGLASVAVIPFVPRLAARTGVLPLLGASVVVGALSLLGFKALWSVAWWFPLRFVFSAALGVLFVLSEYWINAAAPPPGAGW